MPVFFEIATLDANEKPFALMRIDTDKRIEGGCEGVVVSLHTTKREAQDAAEIAKERTRYEH